MKEEENLNLNDVDLPEKNSDVSIDDLSYGESNTPDFSPAGSQEDTEGLDDIPVIDPPKLDADVIKDNRIYNEAITERNSLGIQPPSSTSVTTVNDKAMSNNFADAPTDVGTEKLPSNMGQAVPPGSGSFSRMHKSGDIKSSGNPYGFA
jgi:hypothetical protein